MAARAGTAEVVFEGNFSKLNRQANAAVRALDGKIGSSTNKAVGATSRLGKAADRSTGSLNRLEKQSGRTHKGLRSIGKGAAYALGAGGFGGGLYAVFDVTKKAVTEFKEAERVSRQTAATLKSTGGAAGVSAKHISALAQAISKKTGIDDEAIQSTENLLLTFTKVRNETGKGNKIFDQATKAVTDMSVALKQDGKSSAIQLGKALNDPVRGITSLQRVGVAFTASQKEQIKTLVDSGQQLKAQKIILREINTEFGGSAAAQNTGAKQLQVSLGNLAETVGAKLNPYLARGSRSLNKFVTEMQTGKGQGGQFVNTLKSMSDAIAPVVVAGGKAAVAIGKFAAAHPQLTKVAAAIALSGVAINTIRTSRAVSGVGTLLGVLRRLARTKAGEAAADSITRALGGVPGRSEKALGRTRSVFRRVLGRAGESGGAVAADRVASTAAANVGGEVKARGGKFRGAGRYMGTTIALGAIAAISFELQDKLASVIEKAVGKKAAKALKIGQYLVPGVGYAKGALDLAKKIIPGGRKGGMVFGAGGKVPAFLSSGEVGIEPSGRAFRVPGRPTAADNVAAMVTPGTAILTSSGQAMMAGGASIRQALKHQAPHFAKGGKVRPGKYSSTSYGPPWGGIQGTGITRTGVNLKGSPHIYGVAVDPSQIALGSSLRIQPNPFGTRKPFRAFDTGGAIKGNRIDFYDWRGRSKQLGWGRRSVNVARAGTGAGGKGSTRRGSVTVPAGVTHPLLGSILSPLVDDALLGGIEAGRAGTGRSTLLQSVLEGIVPESTDYGTRKTFDLSAASPGRRGRGGSGGGGGKVGAMHAMAERINSKHYPYSSPGDRSMGAGGPMDCSGAVSKVVGAAGLLKTVQASPYFKTWGAAGKGKHITTYSRGGYGASGHVFMEINGRGFGTSRSNPGGGAGWFTPGASYKGQFIARHPKGYRKGGKVEAGLLARLPVKWRTPEILAEIQAHGIMPGLRKGGSVPGRRPRRIRRRKRPGLRHIISALGGTPGNERAAGLTQTLSKRVGGRSIGALVKARADIKRRIRILARGGLTGQERIQTRRLRGALALIEDEMGRPIGRALGTSDTFQDITTRSLGNLENELIVGGIDPESAAGRQAKIARTTSAIGSLQRAQVGSRAALARAKATGNRTAISEAQKEVDEVDDQILGLRADLKTLSDATKAQTDETERLRSMLELQTQKTRDANQRLGVSERHFDVLRAPFGGSFASGGVVPGPAGAPRIIRAHGGETVVPATKSTATPNLVLNFAPGTEWLRDFVKVTVGQETRGMARGRAPLPGRGGGG